MTIKTLSMVAAAALAIAAGSALAQDTMNPAGKKGMAQAPGEGTPAQPYKASGTHESRSAERKTNRAMATQDAKGGMAIPPGDANDASKPSKTPGTHMTRSAERKSNRADIASQEKAGTLPKPNEAGEPKK